MWQCRGDAPEGAGSLGRIVYSANHRDSRFACVRPLATMAIARSPFSVFRVNKSFSTST